MTQKRAGVSLFHHYQKLRFWLCRKITLPKSPRNTEFVFILGMHRSGTSCLAGSLERCGLFLGKVSHHNLHNIKGNHELKTARLAHDQIFTANGGSWYQPPVYITVNRNQKKTLKEIAAQLTKHLPCGIKDPRLVLLLDIWTEIIDSYTFVGTFRHPVAVAQSLARRNQISRDEAYKLWLRYNAELIRWHKMYHFPLVEFDLSDVEAYRKTTAAFAAMLGLNPNFTQLYEFITPGLDHNRSPGKPVPAICRETYVYLQQHRYQPVLLDDNFGQ